MQKRYREIIQTNGFNIYINGFKYSEDDPREYDALVENPYLYSGWRNVYIIGDNGGCEFKTLEEVKAVVQKFIDSMK